MNRGNTKDKHSLGAPSLSARRLNAFPLIEHTGNGTIMKMGESCVQNVLKRLKVRKRLVNKPETEFHRVSR